ncbi:MAG: FHA domain-containing protein [Anaerolineae bacterium]|nr:FHA domain-containing protein [Anaerolineae bacterium]
MTKKLLLVIVCLVFCLVGGVFTLSAQQAGITTSAEPQFSAYTCVFNPATGRAEIRATLIDGAGNAMPPENVTFAVSRVGASSPLPPDAAVVSVADPRPPLQMIVVLDVTSTMPLEQVRDSLLAGLLSPMPFEDSVALITFAQVASDISQFYNDKNALYNDLLFSLSAQDSPNHLNDAILAGLEATQPNSPNRQVVLVITDSTPQVEQATPEEIITRAQASHTQIIPIALHNLSDTPDDEALFALANATRGFGFAYDGDKRAEAIEAGLTNIFGRVLNVLNSEIVISVDLTGQTPDETGFIPFDITVEPNSGGSLTDRVSCPQPPVESSVEGRSELPQFAVAFTNVVEGSRINDPGTLEVAVQPFDQLPLDAQFVFWLDDEITSESPEAIFPFDPQSLDPGRHTVRVELRDSSGDRLATTPTLNLFTRRALSLTTASGNTTQLSGAVTIQANNVTQNMGEVQFRAAEASNPDVSFPIGTAQVTNDTAALEIPDIQNVANNLFPPAEGQEGWNLLISAAAPSTAEGDPPLGESISPLVVSVAPKPAFSIEEVAKSPLPPIILAVLLLLVDFFLFKQIRKTRIKRTIAGADKHDLPAQLMCVTVSRGTAGRQTYMLTKKTMYVGRGSGNDIQLEDDANVSRQHGAILWRKQNWYFANRKPKVRSKIAGKLYKGLALVKLENPTDIELGSYQLVFHSTEQKQDISDLVKTNL